MRRRDTTRRSRLLKIAAGGVILPLLAAFFGVVLVRAATAHRRPRPVPRWLLKGAHRAQLAQEGHGILFHRRYRVVIDRPRLKARALMDAVKADVHAFSPTLLADFKKSKGAPHTMRPGDEYAINILGPWNGKVRVTEVTPTSFTFVTLKGHPEAGQITFAVTHHGTAPGALCFEINSWARSRDALVSLSYHEGKIGKKVQENSWVTFCERVVEASGGVQHGEIEVTTDELDKKGEVVPLE